MKDNINLLQRLNIHCQTGIEMINQLLSLTDDEKLTEFLTNNLREYERLEKLSQMSLLDNNKEQKNLSSMQKLKSHIEITIDTMMNKSPQAIAEIVIEETTKLVIETTEAIKQFNKADQNTKDMVGEILRFEQKTIDDFKRFL